MHTLTRPLFFTFNFFWAFPSRTDISKKPPLPMRAMTSPRFPSQYPFFRPGIVTPPYPDRKEAALCETEKRLFIDIADQVAKGVDMNDLSRQFFSPSARAC